MTETISQAIARIKLTRCRERTNPNWKNEIPPHSRWFPGCPGDPECEVCQGNGYTSLDLPRGHPDFGKIFLCDCVNKPKIKTYKNLRLPLDLLPSNDD